MNHYKFLSKDYEALNPKDVIFKQKNFFKEIIKTFSIKTCLDSACGIGWHLYMLDDLGLKCYGSDLSSEMLVLARKNTKRKDILYQEGDYRFLKKFWDIKFDMIICMSNSIRHMLGKDEVVQAFNSMYERLNEDGILIIDNGLSDKLINEKPKVLPGRIHKNQAFYFILEYPNEQEIVFNILNVKKIKDSFDHSFETIRLNSMKKKDFKKCFLKTNFKSIDYFGDFSFTPFSSEESKRMIAIAKKYR